MATMPAVASRTRLRRATPTLFITSLLLMATGCGDRNESHQGAAKNAAPAVVNRFDLTADTVAACTQAASHDVADNDENPLFKPNDFKPVKPNEPLLANVRARNTQTLNGEWNYIVDQLGVGDASPLLRGGVGENASYGASELLEYKFTDAYQLQVPGDWNTQQDALFWYRGIVWYQRDFNYQPVTGERSHIYFGGANFAKDVYVNGTLVIRHEGGFTPFNTDVTDYLKPGNNSVVVKVNSMSGPAQIPTEYNDWMNYGGITRDVMLVQTPATVLRNYKVQLKNDSDNIVEGWVQLDGQQPQQQLVLTIPEAGIQQTIETDTNGYATFSFAADLSLWSPQSPKLYEVELSYGSHSISDQIGFRDITTEGEDILLNGESIFLRGISNHEESLIHPGRAHSQADAEAVISRLKELNANFIRLAHYPHNEYIVRAADKAGILVWSELPVYHNIDFKNPCTLASAKRQYSEMIDRDQNRAAVVLWSLGNETPESDARDAFFKSMAEHVIEQDDTRLLTAALLGFGGMEDVGKYIGKLLYAEDNAVAGMFINPDPVVIEITDPLGEFVDVLGYNEYLGWYLSGMLVDGMRAQGMEVTEAQVRELMLSEMIKFKIVSSFNKPLVISEFGAGAKKGRRGGKLDVWTEDYQVQVYKQQLTMLANSPALRGVSPWVLKDFRAPYRLNTDTQEYWNRKGLVSEQNEPKLVFEFLSDYYQKKAASM
ncbi:Beta-glucuronidase [Sinobacterium norvegicum]|uniref:Beta-glucuronidase n=1 Tax=Sinobacterium norvegicum TaxID=1641715 RepID=A0ABM9AHK2_9GAMM|nr:glycoside hydrolase family 2 TIM barrel-domain containing protein [Sinobacterium norvegicum]CAH0992525.1 Beta-glucuronidase [Sinobacterium norvegicum]